MFRCGLVALFLLVSNPVGGVTGTCIINCEGQANGDYSSCTGCEFYATCAGGQLYVRPCPASLVWDDVNKRCDTESSTCNDNCIGSCSNQIDGFYQSCFGCNIYAVCVFGNFYAVPCLNGSLWDDRQKSCLETSNTCVEAQLVSQLIGVTGNASDPIVALRMAWATLQRQNAFLISETVSFLGGLAEQTRNLSGLAGLRQILGLPGGR